MYMRKGVLFTVEAFIAALLVLSTLFFLYSGPVELPGTEEVEVKENLERCMTGLELDMETGEYTVNNRDAVEEHFHVCLPDFVNYEFVFCDNGCESFEYREGDVMTSRRFFMDGEEPVELILYGWSE